MEFYKIEKVAERYKISKSAVRNYVRKGIFPKPKKNRHLITLVRRGFKSFRGKFIGGLIIMKNCMYHNVEALRILDFQYSMVYTMRDIETDEIYTGFGADIARWFCLKNGIAMFFELHSREDEIELNGCVTVSLFAHIPESDDDFDFVGDLPLYDEAMNGDENGHQIINFDDAYYLFFKIYIVKGFYGKGYELKRVKEIKEGKNSHDEHSNNA